MASRASSKEQRRASAKLVLARGDDADDRTTPSGDPPDSIAQTSTKSTASRPWRPAGAPCSTPSVSLVATPSLRRYTPAGAVLTAVGTASQQSAAQHPGAARGAAPPCPMATGWLVA